MPTTRLPSPLVASIVALGALITAAVVAFVAGVGRLQWPAPVDDGVQLIADGEYTSAVRTLLGALAVAPDDARAHYYLGLAYERLGVGPGVITHLREAVRLAPQQPSFHEALGRAYRDAGDRTAARRELEEAARLDPDQARYHVALGGLLLDQGMEAAALEQLRWAAHLNPHAAEIHLLLATVLQRTDDRSATLREYDEARRFAGEGALSEIVRQARRATTSQGRSVR